MPLIFAMVYEVLARKLFLAPTMWAYDMSRFLYGALFMLGAGDALSKGVHIRADFLYRNFKVKTQGLVDFWLYLLFYFPGLLFFFYMTTGFVLESIKRGERGICILFNELTVLDGHDRTNSGRRAALCLYGDNDGERRINGKVVLCSTINAF